MALFLNSICALPVFRFGLPANLASARRKCVQPQYNILVYTGIKPVMRDISHRPSTHQVTSKYTADLMRVRQDLRIGDLHKPADGKCAPRQAARLGVPAPRA
jgi:hypothetical protein